MGQDDDARDFLLDLPKDYSDLQLAEAGKISVRIKDIKTATVSFIGCREIMDIDDPRCPWSQE